MECEKHTYVVRKVVLSLPLSACNCEHPFNPQHSFWLVIRFYYLFITLNLLFLFLCFSLARSIVRSLPVYVIFLSYFFLLLSLVISSFCLFFYFHAISRLLCSMLFVTFFVCVWMFFLINTNEKKTCNNQTLHRPQPQQIMKIIPALGALPLPFH